MARPERVFTEEEIAEVERLAPSLTQQQLADYFCISVNTLKEIMKRDEREFLIATSVVSPELASLWLRSSMTRLWKAITPA